MKEFNLLILFISCNYSGPLKGKTIKGKTIKGFFNLTMLSWLEQKPRQKNERQKNGICHHAKEVDHNGMEQTTKIFLSSIFLPFEGFCGMILQCRPKQAVETKTEK